MTVGNHLFDRVPMRELEEIVEEIFKIYLTSGNEAREYLQKARRLKSNFGSGFTVVYCWFYSVPQKWSQVEPRIFELAKNTDSFDLNVVLSMPIENIARILKPMIFHNQISFQLKRFCEAIFEEFDSWDSFVSELNEDSIFTIFEKLRKYKGIRLSFKNLAAMKILVSMDDDLLILDRHLAKVFGLSKIEQSKYRSKSNMFLNLLSISEKITEKLKERGLENITMAKWSLSIWFYGAKMSANELL